MATKTIVKTVTIACTLLSAVLINQSVSAQSRDRMEDRLDKREDVRDRRENVIDRKEDRRDRREDVRDHREGLV